jgi:hypothetical protein
MKKFLLLIGLLLVLIACTPTPEVVNETIDNTTLEPGAQKGDLVSINFILRLENGTIVDTNNPELAEENNVKNYIKGDYTFILGQSGKVKGFDDKIIGMHEGEHRETIIPPSEDEIIVTLPLVQEQRRFVTIPILQAFPFEAYEGLFKKPPIIGDVVKSDEIEFTYQVVNITEKRVIGKMVLKEGEEYTLPNTQWPSKVVKVAEEDVMFGQAPEENMTIETPFGNATVRAERSRIFITNYPEINKVFNRSIDMGSGFALPQQFQVITIEEDGFKIKKYGSLADKKLSLEVDMLSITPNVKKVKEKSLIAEAMGGNEN